MKPSYLNISPDIVCGIVMKLKEFYAKEEVEYPEESMEDAYEMDGTQILSDYQDDLTYDEIKSTIDELEPDQQYELAALVFIGNEEYPVDDWSEAIEEAENIEPDRISDFILSMPLSPVYLTNALSDFGIDCDV